MREPRRHEPAVDVLGDPLEVLGCLGGLAQPGKVVERARCERELAALDAGIGGGAQHLERAPVLAAQPRVPSAATLDVDVHHANRRRRLGVEVLERGLGGVEVAAQRQRVREAAESPACAGVHELAPEHGRLPEPPGGGVHAALEQAGAAEHDR